MSSASDHGSVPLALSAVLETLRISLPTVVDAARGRLTRDACDARLAGWSARVVERAGIDLRVHGALPAPGEAFVVMSNHQSHFDIPCLYRAFPRSLRMVAKTELFRIPLFGRAMRAAEFVEVDRGDRAQARESLSRAGGSLRDGINVWIAPEGTRSVTGALGPFKKGGFVLAEGAGVRILPVTVSGTREVLPVHAKGVRVGRRVDVTFHAPVATSEGRDATMAAVRAAIASALPEAAR
jgi:1-acyl-sn-glycerol-3-phosphate acyltransferase